MSFLQQLLDTHGDVIVPSLARHLELTDGEPERVVARIVPLVLGGLARQAKTRGPEALIRILEEHGNESSLSDPQAFLDQQSKVKDPLGGLGSLMGGGGGGLLGGTGGLASLFGNTIANLVTGALANYLNLEPAKAAKVLPMLVPLIMASLRERAAASDAAALPELVQLLEEEGDASALEELAGKILGGGNPLGGLLRGAS